MTSFKTKVSESIKEVSSGFVKVSESWKSIDSGYTKVNGSWKKFFGALPYDAEVEYLGSSGTQYINTSIYLTSGDIVSTKIKFHDSAGSVYGCYSGSSGTDNFCLYGGSSSADAYIRFNGQSIRAFMPVSETVYEITHSADGFIVNNSSLTTFNTATFTCSAPLKLWNLSNSTSAKVKADIYEFSVERNGTKILDMIPVRVGQVGYMYDKVSKELFGNDGTGDFSLGSDI